VDAKRFPKCAGEVRPWKRFSPSQCQRLRCRFNEGIAESEAFHDALSYVSTPPRSEYPELRHAPEEDEPNGLVDHRVTSLHVVAALVHSPSFRATYVPPDKELR
jgi:hypothetical protein